MLRLTTLLALGALVTAIGAAADDGRSARGTLVSVSATSISVQDAKHVVTTCALGAKSPSVDGYAVGDIVQIACRHGKHHDGAKSKFVLAKLRKLVAPNPDHHAVTFAGAVTALSSTSISLHDGNRDLTCTIDGTSPPTGDVKVGGHAGVACVDGLLVKIVPIATAPPAVAPPHEPDSDPAPPAPPPGTAAQTAAGNITALSATSISIHNDEHGGFDVTCGLGPSSPSLGDYAIGDRVGLACLDGVLAKITKINR